MNSKEQRNYDKYLYKAGYLIENFFAKLKQYRLYRICDLNCIGSCKILFVQRLKPSDSLT
ncbi:hypothetical protein [Neosynechococcus sphagnicola]|uniref:hypothetical protein n=1 Tax=Neosynechococcus sphagnicola TaxID=1501145 RepID=UPI00056CC83F